MSDHIRSALQSVLFFVSGVGAKTLFDWWTYKVMRRGG